MDEKLIEAAEVAIAEFAGDQPAPVCAMITNRADMIAELTVRATLAHLRENMTEGTLRVVRQALNMPLYELHYDLTDKQVRAAITAYLDKIEEGK